MTLNKILKWTVIGSIFATFIIPFIVSNDLFFPFITGKNFLFRILVEIGFAAWLLLIMRDAASRPRKSILMWAFGAFVVAIGLADIFGMQPWKSFWSNFERMEGYVTILHLFAYFLMASTVMATEKIWQRFLESSVWSSVAVSIYGVFQLAGVFVINQGGSRVDAKFGNTTYLAIYLLFNIFFTLILLVRDQKVWKKYMYGAVIILHSVILYYTATRGSILGAIGGLSVVALLIALFDKTEKRKRIIAGSALGVCAIVVLGFIAMKDSSFVANSPVLSRFAVISINETKTQARSFIWPMAIDGWKQHPILGWGQENFSYIFNSNYDPKMFRHEQWFDRTHNVVLDWLVAGGLLGLLSYLSIFAAALYLIWKKTTDISFTEKALLTGVGVGYFFHNLFVFDNIESYILFGSVLAFIHFKSTRLTIPFGSKADELDESDTRMAGPLILVGLVFVLYFFNWRGYQTCLELINALRATSSSPVAGQVALDAFTKALSYDTLGRPETVERLIEAVQPMNSKDVPIEVRQKFFDLSKKAVDTQVERFPGDARYEVFAGSFYAMYNDQPTAEKHFIEAVKLSPSKQSIMYQLGNFYITYKRYDEGIATFKKAYDLEHSNDAAAKLYAISLIYAGKQAEADAFLKDRFEGKPVTDDSIIQTYANLGKWSNVIALMKVRVAADPKNMNDIQNLIAAYIQSGDKNGAINVIRQIIANDPTFKAAGEQYIQQILTGK